MLRIKLTFHISSSPFWFLSCASMSFYVSSKYEKYVFDLLEEEDEEEEDEEDFNALIDQ